MTGFSLVHLVAGLAMLLAVSARIVGGHYSSDDDRVVQTGAVVWHWANVAWVVVYLTFYWATK